MTQDYVDSLEMVFYERHFDFGDDQETLENNLIIAEKLSAEYQKKAEELAENIEDGIAFDESEAILITQTYIFAKRFEKKFQTDLAAFKKIRTAACG